MKKTLLSFLLVALAVVNAKAQYYVPDDINGDGKASTADVPVLVDHLLNGKQDSICVIEVYENGELVQTYTNTSDKTYKIKLKKYVESEDTHEYVDLGLPSGTLWAKTNIGAEKETDYGLYFAWGETTGYTSDTSDGRSFNYANYKWMASGYSYWRGCIKYTSDDNMTDGCWYSNGSYVGTTVDGITYTNLKKLESSDDAATVNWGGDWSMPTREQFAELVNFTDCSWTTINEVSGYKFTNKNDDSKYIFLPAAGYRAESNCSGINEYGEYWTSELSYQSNGAWPFYFNSSTIYDYPNYYERCFGQSVRPVRTIGLERIKVSSITLNSTEVTLTKGATFTLSATLLPEDAFLKTYTWSSSKSSVATVDDDGKVTAIANGVAIITCKTKDGSDVNASCTVTVGVHEYVNLGLPSGTLWAKTNVGAEKETDNGLYFAWGEKTGYSASDTHDFSWDNYRLCTYVNVSNEVSLKKYCTSSDYGTVDGNTEIGADDDAATANWGSNWRMPTQTELEELRDKCTWTWDSTNKGYKVTGTNGNSIFLPAAGSSNWSSFEGVGSIGKYWTSTLNLEDCTLAYSMHFDSDESLEYTNSLRYLGQSIRPVRVKK